MNELSQIIPNSPVAQVRKLLNYNAKGPRASLMRLAERSGHTTCLDEGQQRLIIFGGITHRGTSNDHLEMSTADIFARSGSPGEGDLPISVSRRFGTVIKRSLLRITKRLRPTRITDETRPSPRSQHGSVILGQTMYVFGGIDRRFLRMADLNCYSLEKRKWKPCYQQQEDDAIPEAREGFIMSKVDDQSFIVFGGSGIRRLNDVYLFNCQTQKWTKLEPKQNSRVPIARMHSAGFVLRGRYFYIHGGYTLVDHMNDLWRFDLISCSWQQIYPHDNTWESHHKPNSRSYHTFTLNESGSFAVLFGGRYFETR